MPWQTVTYRLTGSAPLIQHNGQTADPLNKYAKILKQLNSKRNKTDADYAEIARVEFQAGLYMGADGPILPAFVLDAVIVAGAKKSKEGPVAKSACFCLDHAPLNYKGPRDSVELWEDERFRFSAIVRVGMARVSRMRPIFREWSADAKFNVDTDTVNLARVDDWLNAAGTQVGLCEWRPQHGRFTAKRLSNGK